MPVTFSPFTACLTGLLDGTLNLDSHTLKVALLDDSYSFNGSDELFADVLSAEVSGTGYVAGGKALTGAFIEPDGGQVALLHFDDVVWTSSTITANSAVIYDDTASGDPLIAFIDFDGQESSSAGSFTISFDPYAFLSLTWAGG